MSRSLLRALLALLLVACTPQPRGPAPRNRNLVLAEELTATHTSSLFEALTQIRPEFLRMRGYMSLQDPRAAIPAVYVDNVLMGDTEYLRSLNVQEVAEVWRLSAEEATTRWGTGHLGGAILVVTHSRKAQELER